MGYTTRVTGEFAISPPLAWSEFKDSPFSPFPPAGDHRLELVLRVAEETVQTDDGPLLRRTASALVMSDIDEYRAYGLIDAVQAALDAFPGHVFTGRLECEGEENTDMWRVVIRDGRAVKVVPSIVWPDEDGAA
ncbi:hypothetical protein LHJ74_14460 [Streptomyces sp. N2-109]|uniref:Uncharacterized protein n=1 Tax=Streptomyces gossypii TaxID=2883101 RepID=A0ABT2JT83_9ACTN|nr:DUF6205 family protein [Streptomyces gossypii]MCT2591096.1 hypothetical protein [Streptomyces gossypii]